MRLRGFLIAVAHRTVVAVCRIGFVCSGSTVVANRIGFANRIGVFYRAVVARRIGVFAHCALVVARRTLVVAHCIGFVHGSDRRTVKVPM
jgi:hypothetical protein